MTRLSKSKTRRVAAIGNSKTRGVAAIGNSRVIPAQAGIQCL